MMQYKALEYLYKELRRERTGLGRAEKRPGHTDEEIRNIHRKIDILEYVIGVVTAKGEDDAFADFCDWVDEQEGDSE